MKKDLYYKTVEIPHLKFKVNFADMSKLQGMEIKGAAYTCISGDYEATVFIENIEESVKKAELFPYFAHEIVHVIQILCEKYAMSIESEQEHMAYIMHYLLTELSNTTE